MIKGLIILFSYFIIFLSIVVVLKKFTKLSSELIRKMLHLVIAMAVHVYVFAFATWQESLIAIAIFIILVYPLILIFEKFPSLMATFNERKSGEIRSSLLIVHFMIAILILIFWTIMGSEWKYVVVCAVMSWCFGDGAAALVGKRFGRHKIKILNLDGKKSVEGTIACSIFASLATFSSMLVYTNFKWTLCFVAASYVGPVSAITELFSKDGVDTISLPLVSSIIIVLIMYFYG